MMNEYYTYIQTPNFPGNTVTLAAVSPENQEVLDGLMRLGIDCVTTEKSNKLSHPVRSHADMLLHHLGASKAVLAKGQGGLKKRLLAYGFTVMEIQEELESTYPGDCLLNCARIGNYIFCGNIISAELEKQYHAQGTHIIRVNQGYSKCSVCAVTDHAIITADSGIETAAKNHNIDVLKIREGFIGIPGYDYGFIGGCSGKLDKNILGVCGELNTHPDCLNIKAFLKNYGVFAEGICGGGLMDIGGILPLCEKKA